MSDDLSKSIGHRRWNRSQVCMRGPSDTEVTAKGSDLSAYGPCSPLISSSPLPSVSSPPTSVLIAYAGYATGISLGPFVLFRPTTHRPMTHHGATANRRRARSGERVPLSSPSSTLTGAFSLQLPRIDPIYLASLSAPISERDQSHHGRWMFWRYIRFMFNV